MIRLNKDIYKFAEIFSEHGYELYLVGGALRNIVAGLKPSDYDFASSAQPEEVMAMFRKVIPTGMKHGTVTVLFGRNKYEVTTFRVDGIYSNARHPDSIRFTSDIYEDLKRRDFTINAMAYNIEKRDFIDPHNGKRDLKNKIIRAIGNPYERFSEDGLRLIRACRFAAQLGFSIEQGTLDGMEKLAENIARVSAERIMEELRKILSTENPSWSFELMSRTGILNIIIPELSPCQDVAQSGVHEFDVFRHCLYSCDAAPKDNPELRLAALFHDIGKPECKTEDNERFFHFYNHENVSADITERILKRLKFPNQIIENVIHLIRNHMFNYSDEWSDSAVRRFIARVGKEHIVNLMLLRQADQFGFARKFIPDRGLADFRQRINRVLQTESALNIKDLAINGKDLMDSLGADPGPLIGVILNDLLETVLDDPEQNKRDLLLNMATKKYQSLVSD